MAKQKVKTKVKEKDQNLAGKLNEVPDLIEENQGFDETL
jgi:hypothetical protein